MSEYIVSNVPQTKAVSLESIICFNNIFSEPCLMVKWPVIKGLFSIETAQIG